MKKKLTRSQYDEILTCYDEARMRGHNSSGAWHMMLVAAVNKAGFGARSYSEAVSIARKVIRDGI
jgi:hypothetical protein